MCVYVFVSVNVCESINVASLAATSVWRKLLIFKGICLNIKNTQNTHIITPTFHPITFALTLLIIGKRGKFFSSVRLLAQAFLPR